MPDPKVMPEAPEAKFSPEVERELTIPLMEMPEFKGHIREEELLDFDKRDKRMLLGMSVLEQKLDFTIRWLRLHNRHQRFMEAEAIRSRQTQKEINWRFATLKWLAVTLGAGGVAGLIRKLFP